MDLQNGRLRLFAGLISLLSIAVFGTPAQMYDEQGNLTWEADLDIYGEVRTFAGRYLNECPFRWQGQYEDSETGLYYNRFRYYDPDSGNYISQDPIGLDGGIALYAYVHDPNSWVDVFGLKGTCGQTAASLSDRDFVQRIADITERWGIKNGYGAAGTGHVQGSAKHAHADALLQRYQRMTGQKTHLMSETSYLNKSTQSVPRGTAGSARPDVYNPHTGEVFDYKFTKDTNSPISSRQQQHNRDNLPNVTSQTPIHPR